MKAFKIFLAVWGYILILGGGGIPEKSHCIYAGLFLLFIIELIKYLEMKKANKSPKNNTDSIILAVTNKIIAERSVEEHNKIEAERKESPDWEKVITYQDAKCIKSRWIHKPENK